MTLSLPFISIPCFVAQFLTLVLFYDRVFQLRCMIYSCMFYIEWYFAPVLSQIMTYNNLQATIYRLQLVWRSKSQFLMFI